MEVLERSLMIGAGLLVLSVISSKAASRVGVPSLLVFLGLGMLAGSEGPGGIYFDNVFQAQVVGVVALIFILFSGGLGTDLKRIKPIWREGAALATLGVAVTCASMAAFARFVLNYSWLEGFLLGAIVSSTDAAAVFTVLRGKGSLLREKLKSILELESGANDPMAAIMTIGILEMMTAGSRSGATLVVHFFKEVILGMVLGLGVGKSFVWFLNHLQLEFEGLYPVMTTALALLLYGLTQQLGGSGFLAVYFAGLILGNSTVLHRKSLILFHDGISWIMQIAMFLVLGLLVFPSRLVPVAPSGLMASAFLIFISRPAAVFISMLFSPESPKEKALIAWTGLRGSVPIILATYPLLAGAPKADQIFHLVFFIVLTSVLVQGSSLPRVTQWLRVGRKGHKEELHHEYAPDIEEWFSADLKSELIEIIISAGSPVGGLRVIELSLPKGILIVLLKRGGTVLVPRGATRIQPGDSLLVLADKALRQTVQDRLG